MGPNSQNGSKMTYQIRMTASGRLRLPAELRKRLGLANGGDLLVEEVEHGLVLRTIAHSVARARELSHRYTSNIPGFSVDDFLAKRKVDSGM